MVQGFQEGLDISPEFDSRASEPYGNRNGFELLRQLTREFSLRNRAEAIALRLIFNSARTQCVVLCSHALILHIPNISILYKITPQI